ncbi:MAG TPA: helix-hairpin-helix domain-containing protein [Candidatus Eisenbacteria bacterium]
MFRMKSLSTVVGLALGLVVAPLAHAQEGTTPSTDAKASAPATQPAPAKAPAKGHTMSRHVAAPKVDLNSATKEELMKLPGVGDATADKIIAARPFKTKSELLVKKLVTKAQYSKLSTHVIAKQEAMSGK